MAGFVSDRSRCTIPAHNDLLIGVEPMTVKLCRSTEMRSRYLTRVDRILRLSWQDCSGCSKTPDRSLEDCFFL
jgi:hypothetical protein